MLSVDKIGIVVKYELRSSVIVDIYFLFCVLCGIFYIIAGQRMKNWLISV